MSDYTPFPNEDYPDTSPEANAVGNYYYTIRVGTHPAIVAGEEAYKKALCDTGYFCCGPCDCEMKIPFLIGPGQWTEEFAKSKCMWAGAMPPFLGWAGDSMISYTGDPSCKPWYQRWCDDPPPIPPCGVDPVAKEREDTIQEINKARERAVGTEARIRLTQNKALLLSNERLSTIFYNSMLDSAESILVGMTNTFLQAGAIAGAVAGASQIFASTINYYTILANAFIESFEPYSPPPIGGGGGLS